MRKDGASQGDAVQPLSSPWLFGREWLRAPCASGRSPLQARGLQMP